MDTVLLTAEQLAQRLGVKTRTVQHWQRAGMIPARRLTPKVIRYDLQQVIAALTEHNAKSEVDHASE